MAQLDPIATALVSAVRKLSDSELFALVRLHFERGGEVSRPAPAPAAKRPAPAKKKAPAPAAAKKAAPAPAKKAAPAPAKKPAAAPAGAPVAAAAAPKKKPAAKRVKLSNEAKNQLATRVEEAVKKSQGLSASEIAKVVGVPQSRVSGVVKDLKTAKRIFQGGDRRFARYAGDAKVAEAASLAARQNASSPPAKPKKK